MSIGVDIVAIDRMKKSIGSPHFCERLFTASEREYCEKQETPEQSYAGIYAAKEAFAKALGISFAQLGWHDFSISHNQEGVPVWSLSQRGKTLLEAGGIKRAFVSISHDKGVALAFVMTESSDTEPEELSWFSHIKDTGKDLVEALLFRDPSGYKTQYGRVALIGGSTGMVGSVCLASRAALRTGAGLVHAVVPESVASLCQVKLLEEMIHPVPDARQGHFPEKASGELKDLLRKCDAVGIGPGMSRAEAMRSWLVSLADCTPKVVLDADALNALSTYPDDLRLFSERAILTPHEMEMSRLAHLSIGEVRAHREEVAQDFAKKYGVILVLKGHRTVITDGEKTFINHSGNPGMATAGSGDVLTGIISALLGYGYPNMTAARMGCWIHGLAGDAAKIHIGEDGMIASDIIDRIPYVLKSIHRMRKKGKGEAAWFK